MGCQAVGKGYTDENAFITSQEQTLGFGKHSPAVLEANFYRLMSGELLPEAHFLCLCESLQLDTRVGICFKFLTMKEGLCDGKKLLLYAVLLSSGSDTDKATSIWNLYEKPGERDLPPERLTEMIVDILTLALTLAIEACPADGKTMTSERLRAYQAASRPKISKAAKALTAQFPLAGARLQKPTFLEMIRSKNAVITNLRTVRAQIEQTKAMPQRFAAAYSATSGFASALK